MIRVVRHQIVACERSLDAPIGNPGRELSQRRSLVVLLYDEAGRCGHGEASPLPGYSPERLEEVEGALRARLSAPLILAGDRPEAMLNAIREACYGLGLETPSASFALESALLDLAARVLELPAAALLRPNLAPGDDPKGPATRLHNGALLSAGTAAGVEEAAHRAVEAGYVAFKLKLGPDDRLEQDLERLRAVRRAIGSSKQLRLDANRSFSLTAAQRLIDQVGPLCPEYLEEPTHSPNLDRLDAAGVPLALDESLQGSATIRQALTCLGSPAIRVAVLKPAALGLLHAVDLAVEARELGMDVVVTHLFDGPVAMAAAAELAFAWATPERAQGLAPHPFMHASRWRVTGLEGATMARALGPGLPLEELA